MSYRSFKRVLGETNLERKCRTLFGVCLLILISGSFWWYGRQTESVVYRQNPIKGRLLVGTVLAFRHWEVFKPDAPARRALVADELLRDEELHKNQLLQTLSAELQSQKYAWRILRGDEISAEGYQRDGFDWKYDPEGQLEFGEQYLQGRGEYKYRQAIRAREMSCRVCHPVPQAALAAAPLPTTPDSAAATRPAVAAAGGEEALPLLAIVEVTIPAQESQRDISWNRAILLVTAILTVALAMLAAYAIVRYVIVKPLKHLRDVSDEISHGNIELRAEIRTGDEFEELAVAFNRMLRHLVAVQEELRQANNNLDGKLDELAQLNMRLFEMNRLKSDFLATMSHELRTPLNSIIGFSDVLGSISSLDDKQRRYVQNIQKSGKMLLDMINDILDLAKIEAGKADIRPVRFRIEQVVHAQCDMARPLSEKKNIDLEVSLEPELPELEQDMGKVQQVLNNLLSNAIKFTPEGGRIMVSARRSGDDQLELGGYDNRGGISKEDQQTVFEKFRQGRIVLPLGDAMTREYSGTGLGLSIVKEICRLLGGEVSLSSELGRGSTFTVRLPWTLTQAPRLDSPLADSLNELARGARLEPDRSGREADREAPVGAG